MRKISLKNLETSEGQDLKNKLFNEYVKRGSTVGMQKKSVDFGFQYPLGISKGL